MIPTELLFDAFAFLKFEDLKEIPLVSSRWNLIFTSNLYKFSRKSIQKSASLTRSHIILEQPKNLAHRPKKRRQEDPLLSLETFKNCYFYNLTIAISPDTYETLKTYQRENGPVVVRKVEFQHGFVPNFNIFDVKPRIFDDLVVVLDEIDYNIDLNYLEPQVAGYILGSPSCFYSEHSDKMKIEICDEVPGGHEHMDPMDMINFIYHPNTSSKNNLDHVFFRFSHTELDVYVLAQQIYHKFQNLQDPSKVFKNFTIEVSCSYESFDRRVSTIDGLIKLNFEDYPELYEEMQKSGIRQFKAELFEVCRYDGWKFYMIAGDKYHDHERRVYAHKTIVHIVPRVEDL